MVLPDLLKNLECQAKKCGFYHYQLGAVCLLSLSSKKKKNSRAERFRSTIKLHIHPLSQSKNIYTSGQVKEELHRNTLVHLSCIPVPYGPLCNCLTPSPVSFLWSENKGSSEISLESIVENILNTNISQIPVLNVKNILTEHIKIPVSMVY